MTGYDKKKGAKLLKNDIFSGQKVILVYLPNIEDHSNHPVGKVEQLTLLNTPKHQTNIYL